MLSVPAPDPSWSLWREGEGRGGLSAPLSPPSEGVAGGSQVDEQVGVLARL